MSDASLLPNHAAGRCSQAPPRSIFFTTRGLEMTRYITSRTVVLSWRDGAMIADNYVTQRTTEINRDTLLILDACTVGANVQQIRQALAGTGYETTISEVEEALELLVKSDLLVIVKGDFEPDPINANLSWSNWGTEAQYFHFSTKDTPYIESSARESEYVSDILCGTQPPLFKRYPAAPRLPLPRCAPPSGIDFSKVLYQRRTIREFEDTSITIEQLSRVLHMSFAPQQFIDAADFGILPMRNYANAGARSEHEIYVNILNVSNFDCGLFHYNGIERSLEFLAHPLTREQIFYLTYEQPMCAAAAVVLFVTARVDRMGHKYRNPRALRAVYLDTGHLGQTFALVTIANGLGPWQTAAYRDSEVERVLGLDGIEEISLYCLGMGVPIISPVKEITPPASLRTYAKTTFFEDF